MALADVMRTPLRHIIPEDAQLATFFAQYPRVEMIPWVIYDINAYAVAGPTELLFFNGSIPADGLDFTNLEQPNHLQAHEVFLCRQIGVHFEPGIGATADEEFRVEGFETYRALMHGHFRLNIRAKWYVERSPLALLPPGFGLLGPAAASVQGGAAADQLVGYLLHSAGPRYTLKVPIAIPPQTFFEARVRYNTARAVTVAARLGVYLFGQMFRPVQ